jgi:flagellar protein FliJ
MEQYKFPLQKLLDIRINKEEESVRNFLESQRQRNLTEEKLNMLKDDYKKHRVHKNVDTVVELKIKNNYLNALYKSIDQTKDELIKKTEIVELKREDVKLKQIDRKTVEVLKEKRQDAFNKEEEDKERKANDEFALYSFIRRLERR